MKSDIRLSYCDNCIHNNICGIKDELSKLLDTCNKLSTNNFSVEPVCKNKLPKTPDPEIDMEGLMFTR